MARLPSIGADQIVTLIRSQRDPNPVAWSIHRDKAFDLVEGYGKVMATGAALDAANDAHELALAAFDEFAVRASEAVADHGAAILDDEEDA